jgi:hypothetical protein
MSKNIIFCAKCNVHMNIRPDILSQKSIAAIKYDFLSSHSEGKQTIIIDSFPGKSGLEFWMTAS